MPGNELNVSPVVSFMAGGLAGLSVDIIFYPLDTIKTRLQSSAGFWNTGGFRGIYLGLPSVVVGSVPSAAVFFLTYDSAKYLLERNLPKSFVPLSHAIAAPFGEVAACAIRVPVEIVKQRTQALQHKTSWAAFTATIKQEGVRGLYRGYTITLMREIPFSAIQFPIWEGLKRVWSKQQGHPVEPWQASACGFIAGAIAGGSTTPLDVAKTRIMLAKKGSVLASGNIMPVLCTIWTEKGVQGLFAGFVPRVIWISLGGAVFLGMYEKVKHCLQIYRS